MGIKARLSRTRPARADHAQTPCVSLPLRASVPHLHRSSNGSISGWQAEHSEAKPVGCMPCWAVIF